MDKSRKTITKITRLVIGPVVEDHPRLVCGTGGMFSYERKRRKTIQMLQFPERKFLKNAPHAPDAKS